MKIYKGRLVLNDTNKTIFDDIWINKSDALAYYERVADNANTLRAELFECAPDANNLMYEAKECLFEYDINGHYYYNVGA